MTTSALPVAVRWSDDNRAVEVLDQTLLPGEERYLRLTSAAEVAAAIRELRVRGAPAIGVAAALGLALETAAYTKASHADFLSAFDDAYRLLRSARPTAVNLAWAVDRLRRRVDLLGDADPGVIACKLFGEANDILEQDIRMCRRIGELGTIMLPQDGPVRALTICNAGALATAGIGTALAPIYVAVERGRDVHVDVCETRPLLQGSRITAWELARAGVSHTLCIDSAAPLLLRDGVIDVVLVGADRIAANGDVANKVGTYSLAMHAWTNGVPFIVLAPSSTIDIATATGADIMIEHRAADEVRNGFGVATSPADTPVFAPAFDVTPASFITAIVTDSAVLRPPFDEGIASVAAMFAEHNP